METTPQFERFDGRSYQVGSEEHKKAYDAVVRRTHNLLASSPIGHRFDANQTAFLARDLVQVDRDMQRVLYERLQAASFVAVRSTVARGIEQFGYRQIDIRGDARVNAHLGADDAPNIDVAVEEFLFPVVHVTASYQYSVSDMESAAASGMPLLREKAQAATEIIARKLDKLMRVGDATSGITGFFNNPNVPVLTLTNGEWLSATVAEILADLAEAEQTGIVQARDNHILSRLVLPSAYEGRLRSLMTGATNDKSVASFFLSEASRGIKSIERYIALDDATGDDIGADDPPQGILYDPNPENLYCEVPVPFESLPPQARSFSWVVPCRATFGGVVFKRPMSAIYLENLD